MTSNGGSAAHAGSASGDHYAITPRARVSEDRIVVKPAPRPGGPISTEHIKR